MERVVSVSPGKGDGAGPAVGLGVGMDPAGSQPSRGAWVRGGAGGGALVGLEPQRKALISLEVPIV